jgi:5'-methylthioadenosine/S-adenosylhomocysteine nucleosidase
VSGAPILILAAMPEEAEAVSPGIGETQQIGPYHLRRVSLSNQSVLIATTGIGKVAAASATALLVHHTHPRIVIITGTAGALLPDQTAAHWISQAVQHDYGAARASGFVTYPAGAWPIGPAGDSLIAALPQPMDLNLPSAIIASGDSFVEDPALAARLRDQLGATLVDMETAAVAQVATMFGIPWAAIKAATDEANADSAADFHANVRAAARRAGDAVERAVSLF